MEVPLPLNDPAVIKLVTFNESAPNEVVTVISFAVTLADAVKEVTFNVGIVLGAIPLTVNVFIVAVPET